MPTKVGRGEELHDMPFSTNAMKNQLDFLSTLVMLKIKKIYKILLEKHIAQKILTTASCK